MSQPSALRHNRSTFILGASVGFSMGIVQAVLIVYVSHIPPIDVLFYTVLLSLLLWIALFMLVGWVAAGRTQKINTGALAGRWAGLIGGVVTSVGIFIGMFPPSFFIPGGQYVMDIIPPALFYLFLLALFMLCMGTGLGALGGLIRQSISSAD